MIPIPARVTWRDGVFTLTDPDNGFQAIEEYPGASISFSNDGGVNWADMSPNLENADFVSPLVQDPQNYKHIATGGCQIVESDDWTDTTFNNCYEPGQNQDDPVNGCGTPNDTDWVPVFDLGTFKHPGDPNAGRDANNGPTAQYGPSHDTPDDPVNIDVADALSGDAHYVGFCGSCDPVKLHEVFQVATTSE